MTRNLILKLFTAATAAILAGSSTLVAQVSPSTRKATNVRIRQGPEIERLDPDFAIIRWTTNNPGGSPVHYGIVRYGTDRRKLDQTAKSPLRLNPFHSFTMFRVRMDHLQSGTTYYYTVDSMEANGTTDGVRSSIRRFATPAMRP